MPKKEKSHHEQPATAPAPDGVETAAAPETEQSPNPGQEQLVAAREEAQKNWDLYLRARADLENQRKRAQRDLEDANRYANDRLLKEMVPVLDNLERALEHAGQGSEGQGLIDGVTLTVNLFRKTLESFGVRVINAVGTPFDPNLHQAMGQVETTEQPPNTVVTEFQKGYLLNERLLRPALVMIAKAPAATPATGA